MKWYRYIGAFLYMLWGSISGQILDDSTKLIYNAGTTRYQYASDFLYQRTSDNHVDTSILNFHNYQWHFRDGILYQDLGNLGTPLRRTFWEQNSAPGVTLGHDVFKPYMFDPEKIPLFNTRSPFTRLSYIQGSRGLQTIDAEFSRNIKPHWNIGVDVRRMVSLKQFGVSERTEQQFNNYGFFAQTNYASVSGRYKAFAWMDVMHHFFFESGGILPDSGDTQDLMFDYKLENAQLTRSPTLSKLQSEDRRTYYRGYQELSLAKNGLKLFHQLDYQKRILRYRDNYLLANESFYPEINFDSSVTNDWIFYNLMENKAGVKGLVGPVYYQVFAKHRNTFFKLDQPDEFRSSFQEVFLGGAAEVRRNDSTYLGVHVEQGAEDYAYTAYLQSPFLKASVRSMSSSPSLLQEHMRSNHAYWDNTFQNVNSVVASVAGNLKWKGQEFTPRVSYTLLDNLVYYDTVAMPVQTKERITYTQFGGKLKTGIRWFWVENEVVYTQRFGGDHWPVPEWFYMGRVYTYGRVFKKVLRLQTGLEALRSSFYATPSYAPWIQQYHLTDPDDPLAKVFSYWQVNVFLNAYLKRAKFFLMVSHANQNLPAPGYFKTPYYAALGRTIQFGLTWMFYD